MNESRQALRTDAYDSAACTEATPCVSGLGAQPEAMVAAAAAATAASPSQPTMPQATITETTAKDFIAALKTAHRARAAQASASPALPKDTDLIARRIVLRRDRWDALLGLANALQSQRGVSATPAEVAAIVLEAGLSVILEESRTQTAPTKTRRAPGKGPKRRRVSRVTARAKTPRSATRVSRPQARVFTATELAALQRLVTGLTSHRSIQRTLALWLGGQGQGEVPVPVEDLRALCREFKVYSMANFAQNMKKDSACFLEVKNRDGDRLGYALTSGGATAAAELLSSQAQKAD